MEAVAAKNLHRFIHHEVEHLAAVHLGNRAFNRVFFEHLHRVLDFVARTCRCVHRAFDIPRRAVHHRLHRQNLYGHLRQLFLHHSEIADLFAKRFALFRVLRSGRQHVFRSAHTRRA